MPTISTFYGILIQMFWNDHAPPHFHALYGEYEVVIDISTLKVLEGKMPRRALTLVLEWTFQHRDDLVMNWNLCEKKKTLKKIPPLD